MVLDNMRHIITITILFSFSALMHAQKSGELQRIEFHSDGRGNVVQRIPVYKESKLTLHTESVKHLYFNSDRNSATVKVVLVDDTISADTYLRIYSANGKIVYSSQICRKEMTYEISMLPHGVYVLSLENGNKIVESMKVYKR